MDSQQTPRQNNPKPPMAYSQPSPSSVPRYPSIYNGPANGPRVATPQQQHQSDEKGPFTPSTPQQPRAAVPFGPIRAPGAPRPPFVLRQPIPRPGANQGGPRFPTPGPPFQNSPVSGPPRPPHPRPRPPLGNGQQQPGTPLSRSSSLSQEESKDSNQEPDQKSGGGTVVLPANRDPKFFNRLQRNDSTSSVNEQRNIREQIPRILIDNTMADVEEERRQIPGRRESEDKVSETIVAQKKEPEILNYSSKIGDDKKSNEGSVKKDENVRVPVNSSSIAQMKQPEEMKKLAEGDQMSVDNNLSAPKASGSESPEGVKGFDDGQRRSLSSRSTSQEPSPRSPNTSKPPNVGGIPDQEKKKTHFAEDTIKDKNQEERKVTTDDKSARNGPSKPLLSARSTKKSDAENDSGVDESTQRCEAPTTNGVAVSPTKKFSSKSRDDEKRSTAASPVKSPSKSSKSLPRTPESTSSNSLQEKKKLPMNKIQVGAAPSPNLKTIRSKIGSLENTSYKPGGGKVKIENRKLDFSKATPKIAAKNDKYTPSGGDKKITQVKLQWNAKPKVGSLENATYKPGGGDKKIETVKLDFKDKAKPKVGSKDNAKHVPGGGNVKSPATPPKTPQDSTNDIETQKLDIKAESKIGSLNNVKYKPGGGDKKIFNDKDYLKQTGSNVESVSGSGSQSPIPSGAINNGKNGLPTSDENLNQEC